MRSRKSFKSVSLSIIGVFLIFVVCLCISTAMSYAYLKNDNKNLPIFPILMTVAFCLSSLWVWQIVPKL